jgi:hypothetical protein
VVTDSGCNEAVRGMFVFWQALVFIFFIFTPTGPPP